jgi:tRNA(Arg) A34 adenosine deaminase TadA
MSMRNKFFTTTVVDPYEDYTYVESKFISNKDISFIAATAKIALTSDNRFRVGAMVVKSGRVMGGSPNITRRSPRTPPNRFSTHAEIAAINVSSDCSRATLYIARLNNSDLYSISKPCAWCMQKIIQSGITRVVYTLDYNDSCEESISSFYVDDVTWNTKCLSI